MKYRVSDTDIINIDKVEFIEVDGRSINFHTSTNTHRSIYNNEIESNCVFNNIVNHFSAIDLRFSNSKKPQNESEKKKHLKCFGTYMITKKISLTQERHL